MGQLIYTDSNNQERTVDVNASSPEAIIGRSPECTIYVNFASISRQHAKVTFDPTSGRCTITDLGSSNGVMVNGTRVPVQELTHGDQLVMGGFRIQYFDDEAAGQRISPPTQVQPPDDKTFVFAGELGPGPASSGSFSGSAPVAPPPAGYGPSPYAAAASGTSPSVATDLVQTLKRRIAELELQNHNLQRNATALEAERDAMRKTSGPDRKSLEAFRADLHKAHTQLREIDGAFGRALVFLDHWISGGDKK